MGSALTKTLFEQARMELRETLLQEWVGCEDIDIVYDEEEHPIEDGQRAKQVWLEIFRGSECEL